jgi:hypothetical protein
MALFALRPLTFSKYSQNLIAVLAQHLHHWRSICWQLVSDAVAPQCQDAADVRQLVARISEGRFFVACVGQFKRGKSTLLDAFVGEQILPRGVVPVTTVPTVLRYGNSRTARVLIDTRWRMIPPEDLPQYVSEELNPEDSKQVAGVEIFLPSPLLASEMCLVDTPRDQTGVCREYRNHQRLHTANRCRNPSRWRRPADFRGRIGADRGCGRQRG